MIQDIKLKYSVGALLYTPALNSKIADSVICGKFGNLYSLALCLEDTIGNDMIEAAEIQLFNTMKALHDASVYDNVTLPKIFIRVREPQQVFRVFKLIENFQSVLTGFILPKYTVSNSLLYNEAIIGINQKSDRKIWMMPILESSDLAEPTVRHTNLSQIRRNIDCVKDFVLNIRVGGNDFSNLFSVRRHCDETIYDILPIAHLLGDILSYFSLEYVVSGPVWEFFSGADDAWKTGLKNEIKLDKLNGFVGKTVIHPNQIPVVNEMLKVSKKDFEDAKIILNWDDNALQVGKSFCGERMNEVKTHYNWASKTLLLAELYGVS